MQNTIDTLPTNTFQIKEKPLDSWDRKCLIQTYIYGTIHSLFHSLGTVGWMILTNTDLMYQSGKVDVTIYFLETSPSVVGVKDNSLTVEMREDIGYWDLYILKYLFLHLFSIRRNASMSMYPRHQALPSRPFLWSGSWLPGIVYTRTDIYYVYVTCPYIIYWLCLSHKRRLTNKSSSKNR